MTNLTCDPYGSSLELHCAVTGPLQPQFHIQWYLVAATDQSMGTRLGTENDSYHVASNVMNVVGDVETEVRSISSVLATGLLSDVHQNHCIRCQVEFDGVGVSLGSNGTKLCLRSMASYSALPSCSDDFVVWNSTAFCATSQDFPEPTTSLSTSYTEYVSPSQPFATPFPTLPLPAEALQTALPSPSAELSVLPHTSSHHMLHRATSVLLPPPITASAAVSSPSPSNNTATGSSQAAVEGGLFVAIGICIIFIVIIIILMYFVVRLFRQWRWNREKKQDENEDASECLLCMVECVSIGPKAIAIFNCSLITS